MATCRICGADDATYQEGSRQSLCPSCAADTPKKVSRTTFDRIYWSKDSDCPDAIRREFYQDYLSSSCGLREYMRRTISA